MIEKLHHEQALTRLHPAFKLAIRIPAVNKRKR